MSEHCVSQGECLSSIAARYKLHWRTIWNDPRNATLRANRADPNVLYPGDILFVPDKAPKHHSGATEQRHRFVRKGVPAKLRLRLLDLDHQPRSGISYVLVVDGTVFEGATDSDGFLEHEISPAAEKGILRVRSQDGEEAYEIALGHVDPITEARGIRQRLFNLGFLGADPDRSTDEETANALCAFQSEEGLPETRQADPSTLDRLRQMHGC